MRSKVPTRKYIAIPALTLLILFTQFFILNYDAEAQGFVCPVNTIEQITNEVIGDSNTPSINPDGTRIAFTSNADIIGGNPDGNFEIFLFDTLGAFTQITDEAAGDSILPSINEDGTRIAFFSNSNIRGGNPDGNFEIYLSRCIDLVRPIPTLSEWGLIAMAAVLGIFGFMAMRRRQIAIVV